MPYLRLGRISRLFRYVWLRREIRLSFICCTSRLWISFYRWFWRLPYFFYRIILLLGIWWFFFEDSWNKRRHLWFGRNCNTYWRFRYIFFINLNPLLMSLSLPSSKLQALIFFIIANVQVYWRFRDIHNTLFKHLILIFLADIGVILKSSMIYLFFLIPVNCSFWLVSYDSKLGARFWLI